MDFKEQQRLCQLYAIWKEDMKGKYLSFDPVDAFMAGYELKCRELEEQKKPKPGDLSWEDRYPQAR
jgi:hypothetical protein